MIKKSRQRSNKIILVKLNLMQIDPIRKRFTIINRIQELRTMIRKGWISNIKFYSIIY